MSVDQYEKIGVAYEKFKSLPMIKYAEVPSVMGMFDRVVGRSVLDLACGTGYYTRLIKQRGAGRVVGVDLSHAMVEAARHFEQQQPLGVDYVVGDATDLLLPEGPFDLVTAAYLLNYADSDAAMKLMAEGVRRNLASDGEFLTLTQNPDYRFDAPSTRKYGFLHEFEEHREVGPRVRITALLDSAITISVQFPRREVYHNAFEATGFTDLKWEPVHISAEGISRMGDAFWADFLANPPFVLLRARAV